MYHILDRIILIEKYKQIDRLIATYEHQCKELQKCNLHYRDKDAILDVLTRDIERRCEYLDIDYNEYILYKDE